MRAKQLLVTLASGLPLASGGLAAEPAPARPAAAITDAQKLPVEKFPWGTLQWLCNAKFAPGTLQTVGIAEILPGHRNGLHYHPNCEEILYLISGQGTQSYDGRTVELKPGMTIFIPAGVRNNLINTGTEPIRRPISFSSGDRQTVFLEERPSK